MFEFVFLDLDDTILDFHKAESIAVAKALKAVGVEPTPEVITRYSQINKLHWEMLERGELTREEVLWKRFDYLFRELGSSASPTACRDLYEELLCEGYYFMDGAQEILDYLKPRCRLFLASNGTARVQAARLHSSGVENYLERAFVSQEIGHHKPSRAFFDACFAQIQGFDPEKAIIIGDSLTSDIRGGNNAGITACWYNPQGKPNTAGVKVDLEIRSLAELKNIL